MISKLQVEAWKWQEKVKQWFEYVNDLEIERVNWSCRGRESIIGQEERDEHVSKSGQAECIGGAAVDGKKEI